MRPQSSLARCRRFLDNIYIDFLLILLAFGLVFTGKTPLLILGIVFLFTGVFSPLLVALIDALPPKILLLRTNRAYARLRKDPVAWAQELEERKLWEVALMDGLENNQPRRSQ